MQHQIEGVQVINQRGSLLIGDEPGVGKTAVMIDVAKSAPKVLVLTMATLKYQFEDEIRAWLPNSKTVVINGKPEERKEQWETDAQFYVCNYEMLLRDLPQMLKVEWDYILADECTRLSNHMNKQWKALQRLKAKVRIAATGTAISNSPLDCYGIFEWIKPGIFGSFFKFGLRYVIRDQNNIPRAFKNMTELAEIIKPYYIRRTKEQVYPNMPEKIKVNVPVELSDKERKLYNQIREELLFDIEKSDVSKIRRLSQIQNGSEKFMRLRQLVCSMELIGESVDSSKMKTLKDLVTTLPDGKMIIFTWFAEMAKLLNRELPGSVMIIGEVDTAKRHEIIKQFNTDPTCRILIGTKAINYGLNLQAARYVIHYDLPFSVSDYEQRASRSHRNGQKEVVYEYELIGRNTIEEKIRKKLTMKQELSEMLLPVSELKEMLNA